MIARTTIGRSFKGCCGYNMEKVEMGTGQVLMSQGVRDYERGAMVADFVRQAKINPDLTRSVWHTSLSFAPQDEARLQASPQLMQQVATDYLKEMGLDESQYVVIRHTDTDHSHLHIIANRVRSDGQSISDGLNYQRQTKLMRQIERQYKLTYTVEQEQRKSLEKVPEYDKQRILMRDQVRACLKESASNQALGQALAQHGIRIEVNRTEEGVARGLTFTKVSQGENGEKKAISFKGSKLHKELSLDHVKERIRLNAQLGHKLDQGHGIDSSLSSTPKTEITPEIKVKPPKTGYSRGV